MIFLKNKVTTNTVGVNIAMEMSVQHDLTSKVDKTSDTSDNAGKGAVPASRTNIPRKLSGDVEI